MKPLWTSRGMEMVTTTPEQFAARMREDYTYYSRLVKAAGIQREREVHHVYMRYGERWIEWTHRRRGI